MSPRSPLSSWDAGKAQKSPNLKYTGISGNAGNQGINSSKEQKQYSSLWSPAGSISPQSKNQQSNFVSANNQTPEKAFPGLVPQQNLNNNNVTMGNSSPSLRDIMLEEQSKVSREKR